MFGTIKKAAVMGGAGLAAGATIAGWGPAVALGVGAAGLFRGLGSSGKKKQINETSIVKGTPESIVEIHKETTAIKSILMKSSPAAEKREEKLDEDLRQWSLVDALKGLGS